MGSTDGPKWDPYTTARVRHAQIEMTVRRIRLAGLLVAVVLPQRLKCAMYRRVFGWEIASGVHIGFSFIDAEHVVLGAGAHIGHFNVIRSARSFSMGEGAYVKHLNDFFGRPPVGRFVDRSIEVGQRSLIMSRHFFDLSGTIVIGDDVIIGGRASQFWSHSRFKHLGGPELEPRRLDVGDRVYVGARATLVHCAIPCDAVVGAGAVLTKSFAAEPGEQLLIVGNPAEIVRRS